MSIFSNKTQITAVFVSVAFVLTACFAFAPLANAEKSASSQDELIATLQAQINALIAQLAQLQGASTSSTTGSGAIVGSTGSYACSAWARNLTIGSSGEDVLRLQRFLNSDAATTVATSGAGSPGSETRYYGPATSRAVSRFQEKYSSTILQPLGLTSGTGKFYSSTRSQANSLCVGSGTTPSTGNFGSTVSVVGGDVSVSLARQPANGYAIQGAQRVPFTSFILTAGSDDVTVNSVRVRQVGLSKRADFSAVALVDQNNIQLGSSRSLNSNKEANVGGKFTVPRGQSVTLTVVGDIGTAVGSGVAQLQVTNIESNGRVVGVRLPISGASHTFSSAVTLGEVTVSAQGSTSGGELELNQLENLGEFRLKLDNSGDEDAYLRSITFEQDGSVDTEDFGNDLRLVVDNNNTYRLTLSGNDRYTATFSGKGYKVEEGDRVDLTIEGSAVDGASRTIKFTIDDTSDVYVVGADYGYGLPVKFDGSATSLASNTWNVTGGTASTRSTTSLESSEFDVTYGDDRLIGGFEVEVEGESIEFEDPSFRVTLSLPSGFDWTTVDDGELTIENLTLKVDNRGVASGDEDFVFTSGDVGPKVIKFSDSFTLREKSNRERYIWAVRGDLDTDWPDGTNLDLDLVNFKKAEGLVSEDDYTAPRRAFESTGTTPTVVSSNQVTIEGNLVEFSLSRRTVDELTFVYGVNSKTFATLEIDASNSNEDVEVDQIKVLLEVDANGKSKYLRDCELVSGSGDSVTEDKDPRGIGLTSELVFNFNNNYKVNKGDVAELSLNCDVDDEVNAAGTYTFKLRDTDRVSYNIGTDNFDPYLIASNGPTITVGSTLSFDVITSAATGEGEDGEVLVVATGISGTERIKIGTIGVESKQSDVTINEIELDSVAVANKGALSAEDAVEAILTELELEYDDRTRRLRGGDSEFGETTTTFKNLNFEIRSGSLRDIDVFATFEGIDENRTGISGAQFSFNVKSVKYQGRSGDTNEQDKTVDDGDNLNKALTYRSIPTVSARADRVTRIGTGKKLYEFTVAADGAGDIYIGKLAFDVTLSNGATISSLNLHSGTDRSSTALNASAVSVVLNSGTTTSGVVTFDLTSRIQKVQKGGSRTFSVYGTAQDDDGSSDSSRFDISLQEGGTPAAGAALSSVTSGLVWSPNSDGETSGPATTDTDWFNGGRVVTNVNSWTVETD